MKQAYDIGNYHSWDSWNEKKQKLVNASSEEYCIACGQFHTPNKAGQCPNCKTPLTNAAMEITRNNDNLKEMGVEPREVDMNEQREIYKNGTKKGTEEIDRDEAENM